jgi:hypothetical protein
MGSKMDLNQFLSFNNWNSLSDLSFYYYGWFNNDDWRALVLHADNFKNLKHLNLRKNVEIYFLVGNRISVIKEGDIDQFKSLK